MVIGRAAFGKPSRQTAQVSTIPAPFAGIDARRPFAYMQPDTCVYTFNMMPGEFGMRIRKGYREHQIGLPGYVRTLMPFAGEDAFSGQSKLFAAVSDGIYDVTNAGEAPIRMVSFNVRDTRAGYGSYTNYTDQAGVQSLFYADEVNGLFRYDAATNFWSRPTGIDGPDVTNIAFVVVHKLRIWFVERASTKAWYLPPASSSGQATEFFFGSKFKHGGGLVGLYNWTIDGGEGVDDYLVAISSAGDVMPYKGIDPSTADTWGVVGSYYVGDVPAGRNIAQEQGGMLMILSTFGLVSMADLLNGAEDGMTSPNSPSYKVTSLMRELIKARGATLGWDVVSLPSAGALAVVTPKDARGEYQHLLMNVATSGWGIWRDLPMNCVLEWRDRVFIGTDDGRVCAMDATLDNVLLDGSGGDPVKFSLMTSYQRYDADGMFKQVQLIRPDFVGTVSPAYNTRPVYDYRLGEVSQPDNIVGPTIGNRGVWDFTEWDDALWQTGDARATGRLLGGGGVGRSIAIAIKGSAVVDVRLGSIDVILTRGGAV